jgi:hypothetical protein
MIEGQRWKKLFFSVDPSRQCLKVVQAEYLLNTRNLRLTIRLVCEASIEERFPNASCVVLPFILALSQL